MPLNDQEFSEYKTLKSKKALSDSQMMRLKDLNSRSMSDAVISSPTIEKQDPTIGVGKAMAIRGRTGAEQFSSGLPSAGMLAGGVIGGLSPVPGGAIMGAALGAAGGASLQSALGGGTPMFTQEGAKELTKQALVGGTSELAGQKILSPAISQSAVYATKAKDNILKVADKYNLPLSIAEIKQSRFWSAIETAFDNIFTSAPTIEKFKASQINAIKNISNQISSKFGTTVPKEEVGLAIQSTIKEMSQAAREADNALYSTVREVVDNNAIVDLSKARLGLRKLMNEQMALPPSFQNKQLMKKLDDMLKGDFSIGAVTSLRSELGNLIDGEMTMGMAKGGKGLAYNMTPLGKKYTELKAALEEPLDNAIKSQSEDAWALLNIAKADFAKNKKIFSSPAVKKIIGSNPELIVQSIIKPNRVTEIKQVKSAIGDDGFAPIRERFTQDIVEQMVTTDSLGKQVIRPGLLKSTFDKYGKDTIREIYGRNAADELYEIATLTSRVNDAYRMFGNTSGTARVQNILSVITGGGLATAPIATASGYLAAPVLAKMYLSKTGRKLITEGIKINPSTELGARQLAAHSIKIANFLYMGKQIDKAQRDEIIKGSRQ